MDVAIQPTFTVPANVRLRAEARKSRRRFYPSTILYTAYAGSVLLLGLQTPHKLAVVGWYAGGVATWTLLEYFVHRFVLHGRFPSGPTPYHTFTHRFFDPLHWEHHARPWDGNHISGSLKDTLAFSVLFVAVSLLFPLHTGPVFVAGLLQAYVVEEWVHHSVHFYNFRNPYFRYIRRHHLYHHSPKGMNRGYGLTNGFWDIVWNTRFPAGERKRLYARRAATQDPERRDDEQPHA